MQASLPRSAFGLHWHCITFLHRICLPCAQSHSPLCSTASPSQAAPQHSSWEQALVALHSVCTDIALRYCTAFACSALSHIARYVPEHRTNNYGTITQFKCKNNFEHLLKGLKLNERSWTCPECGTYHDRDFNATCNIKEFGLKALPSERGKVKPVDCPTVDDRPRVLKSRDRKKQEKRGGIGISEAAKSLV